MFKIFLVWTNTEEFRKSHDSTVWKVVPRPLWLILFLCCAPSQEQYKFCYEVALEALNSFWLECAIFHWRCLSFPSQHWDTQSAKLLLIDPNSSWAHVCLCVCVCLKVCACVWRREGMLAYVSVCISICVPVKTHTHHLYIEMGGGGNKQTHVLF